MTNSKVGKQERRAERQAEKPDDGLNWAERLVIKLVIQKIVKKMSTKVQGSKNTTIYGIVLALSILLTQATALLDGDPATVIDINVIIGAITGAFSAWRLGQNARDRNVTSEQEAAAGTPMKEPALGMKE